MEVNDPDAVLLPGIDERSRTAPAAGFAVLHAHKNGLAVTDGASLIEGYGAAFGTLALASGFYTAHVWISVRDALNTVIFAGGSLVLLLLWILPAGLAILFDCTGYREQPTLFDRASGRIHIMHSQRDWLRPWRWFRIPVSVQSFDWRCIRALIVPTVGLGGAGAPRMNYALRLVQTDVPNGTRIVASFGVGIPSVYDGGAEPAALWEHVRRFMQEDGPHLGPYDALYVDDSSPSRLWNAIWWWQPLLGPGAKQFWMGPYWFLTIPFGLVALICLPLTMAGGFIRWLSYRCKRPAPWPAEVLASIGPPLSTAELAELKK
ncbi:hypothetical protein HMPREF3069_01075 [Achromobacter xylosoxidans]|nr:hypothetical protein ABW35_28830 [Achromobacter xylosoxidans]KOQ19274.1 hypothetical protein ABW34_26255 [Achromobacter xylosoxidans]KOQ27836.1 hypothetical protein ABW36_20620 [Achromobacter xylosoxidans]KOQ36501.1 hypothetical protein ABW38_28770 [Achromobacter xylosoxidans]KOQ39337.1 hypothetical protein ABW39_25770 [Achromobacter xylosoxidans]